eukprot:2793198-Rhodomonas_salina.1
MDASAWVAISHSTCERTSWIGESAITCLRSSALASTCKLSITSGGRLGSSTQMMSFDAPLSSTFKVHNQGSTGSVTVSLQGSHLGSNMISPRGSAAGTPCQGTTWSSDSEIQCRISAATRGTRGISVTCTTVVGSFSAAFSIDGPVASSRHQSNAASTGSSQITVVGANLGIASYSARVSLVSTAAEKTYWISDSSLPCLFTSGRRGTGVVAISSATRLGTSTEFVTVDSPHVSSFAPPNSATVGDRSHLVSGLDFGTTDSSDRLSIERSSCQASAWRADTSLRCKASQGIGAGLKLIVSAVQLVGTSSQLMTYNFVVFDSTFANSPSTGSKVLVVSGQYMGLYDSSLGSRVGETACESTSWSSDTVVLCQTSAGVGSGKLVSMTLSHPGQDARVATSLPTFTFDGPSLVRMHASNMATDLSMRSLITLAGAGMGTWSSSSRARLGQTATAATLWLSASSLGCLTSSGASDRVDHSQHSALTVATAIATLTESITFDTPVVTLVVPPNSPTVGGGIVSVHGRGFGIWDNSPTVSLGVFLCTSTAWQSETTLLCHTTGGYGNNLTVDLVSFSPAETPVVIFDDLRHGALSWAFSYDAPRLSSVTPAFADPYQMNLQTSVRLEGQGFGALDPSPSVFIGQTECESARWLADDSVWCTNVPPGLGKDLDVSVIIAGQESVLVTSFSYSPPISVTLKVIVEQETLGGNFKVVEVSGEHFGAFDASQRARAGSTACERTEYISDTYLKCQAARQGTGDALSIVVSSAKQVGTGFAVFSYHSPESSSAFILSRNSSNVLEELVISNVYDALSLSRNIPSAGGWAGITGQYFGNHDVSPRARLVEAASSTTIVIVGTACASSAWTSDSSIACKISFGMESMFAALGLAVTISGQSSHGGFGNRTEDNKISFDSGWVSHAFVSNSPASVPRERIVSGQNLGHADYSNRLRLGQTSAYRSAWFSDTSMSGLAALGTSAAPGGESVVITILEFSSKHWGRSTLSQTLSYDTPVLNSSIAVLFWTNATRTVQVAASVRQMQQEVDVYSEILDESTIVASFANVPVYEYADTASKLVVLGKNIGVFDSTPSVSHSVTSCEETKWLSDKSIVCRSASRSVRGTALTVLTAATASATQTEASSFDLHRLAALQVQNSAISNSNGAILYGTSFAERSYTPEARAGLSSSELTLWISDSVIHCQYAAGVLSSLTLSVTSGQKTASLTEALSFDTSQSPPLRNGQYCVNLASTGANILTLFGSGFSNNVDVTQSARIGGTSCEASWWISATTILCRHGSGKPSGVVPTDSNLVPENMLRLSDELVRTMSVEHQGQIVVTVAYQSS